MAEYDAPVACIRVRFCYGHTLGRFGYLGLEPVHAALSTTVHSSGLISNHRRWCRSPHKGCGRE